MQSRPRRPLLLSVHVAVYARTRLLRWIIMVYRHFYFFLAKSWLIYCRGKRTTQAVMKNLPLRLQAMGMWKKRNLSIDGQQSPLFSNHWTETKKPRHMMFEIQSLACVRQQNVVVANYPLPIETLPLQVDIGGWIHVSAVIRVAP